MSLNKLNTASKAELMMINGIGEKKADAIIKERRKGKFKSFEDFQRVDGIGEETAKNVKNDVKIKKDVKETKKSAKKSTKKKAEKKKSSSKKSKTDKKKK
jgi:competence protein ComEA